MRGQITMAVVIGWGVAIAVAAVGIVTTNSRYTDSKISNITSEITTNQTKISSLEAQVPDINRRLMNIEDSQKELSKDIKEILKVLK